MKKNKINKMGLTAFILMVTSVTSIFILVLIDYLIGFNLDWSIIPILSIILFIITVTLPFMRIIKRVYWLITIDAIALVMYFTGLNYVINHKISWSYYISLSIILVWVYLSTIFINKLKSFILKLAINFIATAIFVLFISIGYKNESSFAQIALPINGLVFILTVISYLFIKTFIYNWRVVISAISINISILCLGIDLFIQRYLHNEITLKWSYIVLLVLIPLTLFLMYLDNHYKIHLYIKKKFHI